MEEAKNNFIGFELISPSNISESNFNTLLIMVRDLKNLDDYSYEGFNYQIDLMINHLNSMKIKIIKEGNY